MSKIYIIDDDRDIVDAMTMILESEDHEIAFQNDEDDVVGNVSRSEEHTSELQSHSFISYAVFCLKKKKNLI